MYTGAYTFIPSGEDFTLETVLPQSPMDVGELLEKECYVIDNIDATVIAQKPKLNPYLTAMREKMASVLGIPVQRLNVKATTEEKMGFTGRGEGISAHAVCLLREKSTPETHT